MQIYIGIASKKVDLQTRKFQPIKGVATDRLNLIQPESFV